MKFPQRQSARSDRGAALIITLAVLVLMTIMVVSLSDSVRIERGSARSHLEKTRAEALAQVGIERVVARLRQTTAKSQRNWISLPGRLVAAPASGSSTVLQDASIDLFSGTPTLTPNTPSYFLPAELNISTFGQTLTNGVAPHLITDLPDPKATEPDPKPALHMLLKWCYVRRDGAIDLNNEPDLKNTDNPIVGRYAFWTDDESCKVNYNLAWTRGSGNPNPASHPTKVNLPTLLGGDNATAETLAAAIHLYQASPSPKVQSAPATASAYKSLNRFFFNTPEDARQVERVNSGIYDALNLAKFNVTHYNHDPDTTFFNEPRIVLTCRKDKAAGRPFLDIGVTDNIDLWDPITTINPTKLADVIDKLNSYLKRTDWPMAPNSSLQDKYYAGKTARLTQLSLNIINYVRSKESAGEAVTKVVIPVRGEHVPGGRFEMMEIAATPTSYIGVTRTPKITEMGIWVSGTPSGTNTYPAKVKLEIYLPLNFGLDQIDLKLLSLYLAVNGSADETTIRDTEVVIAGHAAKDTILRAGEYATITRDTLSTGKPWVVKFTGARPTGESLISLRFAIHRVRRLDVTPVGPAADCTLNGPSTPEKDISSIEIDDPRVNSHRDDWKKVAKNTFGSKNSISTLGTEPKASVVPQQDVDQNGLITDISLVMPAPAGTSKPGSVCDNPSGVLSSAGELGYIHTGMESSAGAGIPWRTLRLQPNNYPGKDSGGIFVPTGVVYPPDWAFMDLFTVPADVPNQTTAKAVFSPHDTATGGRVNMNAKPEPFDIDRVLPLAAVFQGARTDATNLNSKLSFAEARTIAEAVYNHKPLATAAPGNSNGKQYGYRNGYDSPGEVVEIKGVADRGEASEQLLRDISNLITSRGNVFSIYTVVQALKQTPNQRIVVTGEQRQQAMVERYVDNRGTPDTSDDKLYFRTVFVRNLLP
ncbi:MAG: hypothetical protein QOE70_2641 [Chthoniobacter sp.]|jgi:hypothetical protein|nr:hypothetical protein [Chthoniobacter sp.]